jgi:hypothetical protein
MTAQVDDVATDISFLNGDLGYVKQRLIPSGRFVIEFPDKYFNADYILNDKNIFFGNNQR